MRLQDFPPKTKPWEDAQVEYAGEFLVRDPDHATGKCTYVINQGSGTYRPQAGKTPFATPTATPGHLLGGSFEYLEAVAKLFATILSAHPDLVWAKILEG
ncbi:MAG: hypothetical protein EXR64_06245 [Dehalococcoidia bacterium]|nr:hypothetical protein [Dehalococcoidia bacterium]